MWQALEPLSLTLSLCRCVWGTEEQAEGPPRGQVSNNASNRINKVRSDWSLKFTINIHEPKEREGGREGMGRDYNSTNGVKNPKELKKKSETLMVSWKNSELCLSTQVSDQSYLRQDPGLRKLCSFKFKTGCHLPASGSAGAGRREPGRGFAYQWPLQDAWSGGWWARASQGSGERERYWQELIKDLPRLLERLSCPSYGISRILRWPLNEGEVSVYFIKPSWFGYCYSRTLHIIWCLKNNNNNDNKKIVFL